LGIARIQRRIFLARLKRGILLARIARLEWRLLFAWLQRIEWLFGRLRVLWLVGIVGLLRWRSRNRVR
jgi:hypothetical protein